MHDEHLKIAIEAAMRSGEFLRDRSDIHVEESTARDIKLSSDKRSEQIILDALSVTGLPVLSEECGLIGGGQSLRWIVDPLDGSVNYYKGIDELCCVSIALFDDEKPILGVVNRFAVDEVYSGMVDVGAVLNGKPIKPSDVDNLSEAVLATGFPNARDFSEKSLLQFAHTVQRVKKVRMLGSSAIMAAMVACGRVDAYHEESIRLWDIAGAMSIIVAAGGAVSLTLKQGNHVCDFGAFATRALMGEFYGA